MYLTEEQYQLLKTIAQSRTKPVRDRQRAKILLKYKDEVPISEISLSVQVNRKTAYKCIQKALTMGIESGLKDQYHSPKDSSYY